MSGKTNEAGVWIWGIIQIIFIVAKLVKLIDWSWWLVFLPMLISFGVVIFVFIIALIIGILSVK